METFADIINRLMPRKLSMAKLSREADIEYSYFHSLMQGHRTFKKDVDGEEVEEERPLRAKPDKGLAALDALERLSVRITEEDRARMITACLPLPAGYRVMRDNAMGEGSEPRAADYDLLFASGWERMSSEDKEMFGELMEAWTARKSRQMAEQRNAKESVQ